MKKKFQERVPIVFDENKIMVCYAGIDRNIFKKKNKLECRISLGIDVHSKVMLSVSRVVKKKGYLCKINHFNNLLKIDPNLKWVIVGDGDYLEELKEIARNKNLIDNIYFAGSVKREKLSDYYSAADVFWLLSEYDESFGLVYLEAQACGLYAVGRMKSGVVEAIVHDKTGFLIKDDMDIYSIMKNQAYKDFDQELANKYIDFINDKNIAKLLNLEFCD